MSANTLRLRHYLSTLLAELETAKVHESVDRTSHHDSVSYEIELPGQAGVTFTLDRTRRLRKGALLAVFLLALLPAPASALEGFRCQHSTQCDRFELCVADSPSSTWGTCRALKILP